MHKHNHRFSHVLRHLFCLFPLVLSACGGGGEPAGSPSPPPTTPAPTLSFSASPASLTAGQSSTLTWSTTNATGCTASVGWSGSKAASGTEAVSPSVTTTYTLACTGAGGSVSRDATVTVTAPVNTAPTATATTVATAQGGGRIILQATATDKEGGALAYFWRQSGGPIGAVIENSDKATTWVTLPKTTGAETISFEVKVTDSGSLSGFGAASVTVSTGFIPCVPTAVPAGVPGANPFFAKYCDAGGIPVLASSKVADRALAWARYEALEMLKWRPDVAAAMVNGKAFIVVMALSEDITEIPGVPPDVYEVTGRPRPLRGYSLGKMTIVSEENLLCISGNRYPKESTFVHEFTHGIDVTGLDVIDPNFSATITAHFNTSRSAGLWNNTYSATNELEWRAVGATDWYDVNMESILGDGVHNFVNTRAELETYDTLLYGDLEKLFSKDTLPLCPP